MKTSNLVNHTAAMTPPPSLFSYEIARIFTNRDNRMPL